MAFSLRCPECRGKFPWNPVAGMPDVCKLCGADVGHDRADDDVVMPFIRTNGATASADKLYRDIEKGSEVRAMAAAEMTGAPVSEMQDLKITNLNSTTHQGDIAAVPVQNAVTQFMDANPNVAGFRGGEGVHYGAGVQSGPEPNAGARMRIVLHRQHAALTNGAAVSDRPALETLQPGYRQRG